MLDALAAVTNHADQEAVNTAIAHVYQPWLRDAAELFQKRVAKPAPGPRKRTARRVPAGTCVLFADGLRYDVGQKLLAMLAGQVGEIQAEPSFRRAAVRDADREARRFPGGRQNQRDSRRRRVPALRGP